MLDSGGEYAGRVLGIGLAVDLERLVQGISCIVRLVEIVLLDGCRFLER